MIFSQQNDRQKRHFFIGKTSAFSFAIASFLSLILMIADFQFRYLDSLKDSVSLLVAPIQYAVDYPVRIFNSGSNLLKAQKDLINENIELRYQQTLLGAEIQKLKVIKDENDELKALLLASTKVNTKAMAAQILAVDTSASRQIVVVNKGKKDGVFIGQPVFDAKGVMGQIVDVGQLTASVLLISDAKSAVPIKNHRTGERAILVGTNSLGELSLINLPNTSNIEKGDLLVTSGLGRKYPQGFPVGVVEQVNTISGEEFINVSVKPIALLNRNRLVLLIWPEKEHIKLTAEINNRLKNA